MPKQTNMPAGSKPISLSKRVMYYGIMFFLMLLIVEVCSRVYYYQRFSAHPVAAIQLLKDLRQQVHVRIHPDTQNQRLLNDQYRVRPNLPKTENDLINNENTEANQAVYEPWVEFAFRDIRGKYVNVTNHVRASVPDRSDSLSKEPPLRIFFLGGSTTYGFNVADAETIPSAFIRAYRQRFPGGRPIQAINLGMPFYFSYQELMLLTDKIFRDQKPDMVIMLDGLNDCLQATASYARAPVFVPGLQDMIPLGTADARTKQANYYDLPAGMSTDSACTMVYRRYIDNIRHAREITSAYAIPLYCFWQPVPYYNYPNRLNDPNCTHTTGAEGERFGKIYPLVRKEAGKIPYLYFLGDMLEDEKGLPFVDQIHYSPRFCEAIAEQMLNVIDFKDKK